MKTQIKAIKVQTANKDDENYHLTFKDYRGEITRKLDEPTARLLVSQLDSLINCMEKV